MPKQEKEILQVLYFNFLSLYSISILLLTNMMTKITQINLLSKPQYLIISKAVKFDSKAFIVFKLMIIFDHFY